MLLPSHSHPSSQTDLSFVCFLSGKETTLYNELKTLMGKNKYVSDVFKADCETEPTATRTITLKAKDMYSKVSFIAMIAPSPDWFVGVDSVELCGSDGKWKETEIAFTLAAWDAGTDSGTTFQEMDNMETMPRDVIRQITKESNTELKGNDDINPLPRSHSPSLPVVHVSQTISQYVFTILGIDLLSLGLAFINHSQLLVSKPP